jgi:capsular exopolysaccharide synthesis family protein
LLLAEGNAVPKIIAITSAVGAEGKTFTAANYAIVLAQQGARVLLVDADLRNPSVHSIFGIAKTPGLHGLLSANHPPQTSLLEFQRIPNLTLLPAGGGHSCPAELLAGNRMRELLSNWRAEYDHILIDTPPVCLFTDSVLLSSLADAMLLVVRSSHATRHAVRHSVDLLQRANARIAGLVLNAADPRYQDAYYFHRYGYLGRTNSASYYGDRPS